MKCLKHKQSIESILALSAASKAHMIQMWAIVDIELFRAAEAGDVLALAEISRAAKALTSGNYDDQTLADALDGLIRSNLKREAEMN